MPRKSHGRRAIRPVTTPGVPHRSSGLSRGVAQGKEELERPSITAASPKLHPGGARVRNDASKNVRKDVQRRPVPHQGHVGVSSGQGSARMAAKLFPSKAPVDELPRLDSTKNGISEILRQAISIRRRKKSPNTPIKVVSNISLGGTSYHSQPSETIAIQNVPAVRKPAVRRLPKFSRKKKKRSGYERIDENAMRRLRREALREAMGIGAAPNDRRDSIFKAPEYKYKRMDTEKRRNFKGGMVVEDGEYKQGNVDGAALPMPVPEIVSVTSSVNLSVALDLGDIASQAVNVEYSALNSSYLLVRAREPAYTSAKIWKCGKMLVMGGTSMEQNYAAARKHGKLVRKYSKVEPRFRDYKVVSMMAKADMRFAIDLPKLATHSLHSQKCSFDPESTTGATYRIEEPKVSANIFHTGKVTFMGAKSREEVHRAFEILYLILQQFQKSLR